MMEKPSSAAHDPNTPFTERQSHEVQFKESTVPVVRFWILSVG